MLFLRNTEPKLWKWNISLAGGNGTCMDIFKKLEDRDQNQVPQEERHSFSYRIMDRTEHSAFKQDLGREYENVIDRLARVPWRIQPNYIKTNRSSGQTWPH